MAYFFICFARATYNNVELRRAVECRVGNNNRARGEARGANGGHAPHLKRTHGFGRATSA
eukprot:1195285-Prorocentrum_minimum.AAC.8